MMSTVAFLATRAVLLLFADNTGEVVKILVHGIAISAVLALATAPSLIGSVLGFSDQLSASGYSGFGSIIKIIVGNYVLSVGAAHAVANGMDSAQAGQHRLCPPISRGAAEPSSTSRRLVGVDPARFLGLVAGCRSGREGLQMPL